MYADDDIADADIARVLPQLQKGLALQQAGKLDEAETVYNDVLTLVPGLGDALHLLGQIALTRGDYARASALIAEAIEDLPEDVGEPHANLGHAYAGLGKAAEAETSYRRCIEIDPSQMAAYSGIARLHNAVGRFEQSLSVCLESFPTGAGSFDVVINLGIALRGLNLRGAAETAFHSALAIDPNGREALSQLASLLVESKRYGEALVFNERAYSLWPNDSAVVAALGATLVWLKDLERARTCFRWAVEIDPRHAKALAQLGIIERNYGNFSEANKFFHRALEIAPELPEALWNIAFTERQTVDSDEAQKLRGILARPDTPKNDRITAGFALGKVLDDNDRYDEAFVAFKEANDLFREVRIAAGEAFDPAGFVKSIDEIIRQSPAGFFKQTKQWGNPSELPVFVVGMPRSGTTLIEQIAASHPQVHGAGELRNIGEIAVKLAEKNAGKALLAEWDADEARKLADEHVARLTGLAGNAVRVVDKLPDNMLLLNLIRALFPKARIIYAKRDGRDCGLSNFFQFYTYGNIFAFDLEHTALRMRETERLGRHWRQVMPGPFLELQYEDLVADLEGQSRRLIDFLGLEWDPLCLAFHKTERTVTTPSSWQVRQPIYTRSVNRWRRYERHLAPFLAEYQRT